MAGDGRDGDARDDATRVVDEGAPAGTRVLDDGRTEILASDDLALAETRVLDEEDKTSPPPAVPAAAIRPSPAPRPVPAPAAREDRGLEPGTILFGEYEIVNVLGVGGMGEVYRAHHRRLDEHRAIKVMHAELSKRRGASEFFYREAKALLAVRHPAVVHCHDLLSDDAGRVYLIMEMIEGIPLSRKLSDGPLNPDEVAILGARVAHGLAAAHRKGVIHRDLSPDNIVLPNGRVQEAKIIDFGIAKLLEQGEGTIVDGFKGKLSYASPEQLGFFGGKIDGRSDLYSLGLVLAAAALGRPMAMGTTVMEAVDARRNLNRLPDGVPIGLRSAIQPLLALRPEDRPQYVDRLFVVPGAFDASTDSGTSALPTGLGAARGVRTQVAATAPRRTGLVAGIAGAALLLVAGGAYLALRGDGSSEAAANRPADARLAASGATNGSTNGSTAGTASPAAPSEGALASTGAPASAANAASAAAGADGATAIQAAPTASAASSANAKPARAPAPAVVAKVAPAPSVKRGPSASDRLRIVGMLTNAKLALGDGRLMTPAGDNAYDRYRGVLRIDPSNVAAKSGLREIAARYVDRANAAIEKGDTATARDELRRARQADPTHSGIRAAESRLAGS